MATGCVAPPGGQQDVDRRDSREARFQRPHGEELVVHVENHGAAPRYWELLGRAAQIWSRSPCVHVEAVAQCPAGASCVGFRQRPLSRDGFDTDGEFSGNDRGDLRLGGTITVFHRPMREMSDNGVLVTIVHELGHALGLRHRRDPGVMNATTGDNTDPRPDEVDFDNLLAIHGTTPQPAG